MNLLTSIAELIGAISAIIGAIIVVEKWTRGKLSAWLLKPVFTRLDKIEDKIHKIDDNILKMDKEQCMNFLNEFIADVRNGVHKNQYQIKRAHDVYEHYTSEDLHGNSYIEEQWEMYMIHNNPKKR